ncbi:hypothetical protein JST97_08115 [bacterium]|nr:hypothetical protein [bacterium]
MDPIYYQVNQTRLTEVTQKTSDNLRLQGNKEAKRKAERAGDVDKAAMSTDSSSMSDDMLGNMDPDDYGGRGAKQFAQMWKEQLEEEEEKKQQGEQDDDEGEPDSEPEEPEDQTAPNKQETEVEGLGSAEEVEVEGTPVQVPPSNSARLAAEAEPAAEPAEASAREQAPRPEPPTAERKAVVTPPTSSGEARAAKEQAPAAEKFSSTKIVEASAECAAPAAKKSSLGSLLDFSSGFLIAEDAHFDENAEAESPAQEAEPEEALPEEISILLERLVTGDSSQPGYRKLNQLLSRFGRRVLQQCIEAHAKVYLLPPGEPLLAHPMLANCGFADLQGAAYLPDQRLCLVEDDCVAQAPRGFHPVFYYFAHLWDHAMGGENFASSKSAAVKASYQVCQEGGHRFGDLMSSHSPAHYFAQAVESYLAENDCFEPLWTRQDLYDFDRSIYDYIEYLLR